MRAQEAADRVYHRLLQIAFGAASRCHRIQPRTTGEQSMFLNVLYFRRCRGHSQLIRHAQCSFCRVSFCCRSHLPPLHVAIEYNRIKNPRNALIFLEEARRAYDCDPRIESEIGMACFEKNECVCVGASVWWNFAGVWGCK